MNALLKPVKIGAWELPNRVVMAPLTRGRAGEGRVPTDLMATYYAQRASAGLIISEACSVSPMGVGHSDTPGIWTRDQVEGWRKVTDAVHAVGGKIILQLWHVGRVSDSIFLDGARPVAPSAIAPEGYVSLVRPKKAFDTPRALEENEISGVVEEYRKGAENAKEAGFDGVEIHGANGYLIEQFLQSASNKRDDAYGGTIENRARFLLEVTDAVVSVWGSDRVGMHLSPRSDVHDMSGPNNHETFEYVARELGKRRIAFICAREAKGPDSLGPKLKKIFGSCYIANESFDANSGHEIIEAGDADAVAFGKLLIANPDFVERIAEGASFNKWDENGFYGGAEKGYTDYPTLR